MSGNSEPLHVKYRPREFDQVIGQNAAVSSLKRLTGSRSSQTFLFVGPSGTGKTTLARIVASEVGCGEHDLLEIDAATRTGVDDMRAVTSQLQYRPLSGGARAIIVDEAHMLSKSAWNSLLKVLEEPPAEVYWLLCTTEPTKVPKTVRTRCASYELKPVPNSDIADLLSEVAEAEEMYTELGKDAEAVLQLCTREAEGSPRQALVNLAVCASASSLKEARELLRSADESPEAVELARLLARGAKWGDVQDLLQNLEAPPETVRRVVQAWMSKAALGAKRDGDAENYLAVLDAFAEPFDGMPALVLACGRIVLAD